jgi:multidrug efflux pump
VLERQGLTLLVALGTLVLTALLWMLIPKGLFPTQDTGQLQARVEARQAISYQAWRRCSRRRARDPGRPGSRLAQLHVGVDAANNTMLHTGTMLINLKEGRGRPGELMDRLRQRVARNVAGVTLYLQPTQDLTIDAESGPTQYRLSIEGADTPP